MFISMFKEFRMFRTFFVLSSLIAVIVAGCGKSGSVRWVHYDETFCADRWERSSNNEKLKENIVNYLDEKGIKVFEIEIFSDRTADNCTECTCKSGRRIKCKVSRRDAKDIKKEGFYEE